MVVDETATVHSSRTFNRNSFKPTSIYTIVGWNLLSKGKVYWQIKYTVYLLAEFSYPSLPRWGKKSSLFSFPVSVLEKKLLFIFFVLFYASLCGITKKLLCKIISVIYRSEESCYFSKRKEFKINWRYSPLYNVILSCLGWDKIGLQVGHNCLSPFWGSESCTHY